MRKGRSMLVFALVLFLLTSMASISNALPITASEQEKVQLLNELNIFTGYNGDYRLNDKLSRSEAAALAVRMLGKELHVTSNKASYAIASYPDIEASSWYAPYVGFCTKQGILSGYTDGYYKPGDYVTEKAFLKIILGVLGYEMNKDFTWQNLYRKAFETGLVTELAYIVKEEDNTNFTRRDAVNVMVNALSLKNQKTEKAQFYILIEEGLLTVQKAAQLKLIADETTTAIEEVLLFDQNNMTILFNENIKKFSDLKIYQTKSTGKALPYTIEEIKKDHIMLKTDKQIPGVEYTIEFLKLEDENGNIQETLQKSFIGYMQETVESDFFRIQKIEPINEKSIKLYFTHPVNMNSENPLFYRVSNESSVFALGENDHLILRTVTSEENCVLLTLKNGAFTEGLQYRVEINGNMTSSYGVRMNDGLGDEMAFKAVAGQTDSLKVMEVITYDSKTIMLRFNKEVNPFLAKQIFNFYVTDKSYRPIAIVSTAAGNQGIKTGEVVFLSLDERLQKNEKYYVTINNLNDVTRQEYITERTYSFTADYSSSESLDIIDINEKDKQTVEVYFSTMLDPGSSVNLYLYTLVPKSGSSTVSPKSVLFDNTQPYKVTLFFNQYDLVANAEYELRVSSDIKDYMGNRPPIMLRESIKASNVEKTIPSIEQAKPISTNAIKLVMDKELAFNQTNLLPGNYALDYNELGMSIRKVPTSVLYINPKTFILFFDELKYDVSYTLSIGTIVDYSGAAYKVTGAGTNFIEFKLEKKK